VGACGCIAEFEARGIDPIHHVSTGILAVRYGFNENHVPEIQARSFESGLQNHRAANPTAPLDLRDAAGVRIAAIDSGENMRSRDDRPEETAPRET